MRLGARIFIVALTTASVLAIPNLAHAASIPTASAIITRACAGRENQPISQFDLAEALLIEAGISPTQFAYSNTRTTSYTSLTDQKNKVVNRLHQIQLYEPAPGRSSFPDDDASGKITGAIKNVVQHLAGKKPNIMVDGALAGQPFSFSSNSNPIVCKTGDSPNNPLPDDEDYKPPQKFAAREKPDELWLTGKEAKKAGAVKLGFERTKTPLDGGGLKTDKTFTINGTVGWRFTPDDMDDATAYLFAQYQLSKARTNPPPTLDPGKSESDGDTDVLKLGYMSKLGPFGSDVPVSANLGVGYVFDFAKNARRLNVNALVHLAPDWDLKLCKMGSYRDLIPSIGLKSRCDFFRLELEGSRLLKRGKLEVGDYNTYLAIGASPKIDLFLPTSPGNDTGFLASLSYRNLALIEGSANNIERWDAEFKHRFWTKINVGVDVGFTFAKGTNSLSLEEEDKLTFGLGIVY
jgi:hypothetical protein